MADKIDLERAVDEMLSDLARAANRESETQEDVEALREDVQHWRNEYWNIKDEYDQMVSKLEELVRIYCG